MGTIAWYVSFRKRCRNVEDEVEFMPLSKRINNLHINNGSLQLLENGSLSNTAEWGAGLPHYHTNNNNTLLQYSAPETPPESIYPPEYNPVLDESQNPHYFYKNKLLYEMHIERMERNRTDY